MTNVVAIVTTNTLDIRAVTAHSYPMPTTQTATVTLSNPFDTMRAKWSARQARLRAVDDRLAAVDAELGSLLDVMDRSGS